MNGKTHPVENEEVMAYLDGQLEAERASAVAAHLKECAACQALEADLRGVSERTQQWQVEPAPARLKQKVDVILGQSTRRKRILFLPVFVWQWGAAAAILLIVAAISVPNLMRSRTAANEAVAVGALRTIATACVTYASQYGGFPLYLGQLGPGDPPSKDAADLIDPVLASGTKSGYRFEYTPETLDARGNVTSYSITAQPVQRPETGVRSFYSDSTGLIRSNPNGPATALSASISGDDRSGVAGLMADRAPGRGDTLVASREESAKRPGPMLVRTASLILVTNEFGKARSAMEQIVGRYGGHIAQLSATGQSGGAKSLSATLRIPADKLDSAVAELKALGRVQSEALGGEEVTQEHADLVARHANAQQIEKRLTQVLENRTGKVKDVLEVEREIARVREEIERMDAQRKNLENRVQFATVQLRLAEEYQAQINPPQASAWLEMRNAAVDGLRSLRESVLGLILFLLSFGPPMLFWLAVLFVPARFIWRRVRGVLVSG